MRDHSLFSLGVVRVVRDTLVSMLQALAANNLTRWLVLIKDLFQASSGEGPFII